jgi:DNA-binding transcriptional LysR family regulator
MTLEQILTIEAIIQKGSFKAAAVFLCKSQPSVSMAIKKLEDEYQITLFSRDQYRPSLTNEGRIFFEKARSVLKEFRELQVTAQQMSRGEEVELRIGIDAISPVSLILHFLKKFFEQHPHTVLQLSFEVLYGTLERLIDGEVDFAITPMKSENLTLESQFLTTTSIIPVMKPDFIKEKKVSDSVLKNYKQIILADSSRHSPKISTGVLEGGKSFTLSEISFKKEMILQGLGWGSLPYEMVKSELAKKKLVVVKTASIKESKLDIYLVHDPKKSMGPVARELWEKMSWMTSKSQT